jgi:hypothetical protein
MPVAITNTKHATNSKPKGTDETNFTSINLSQRI